MPRTPRTKILRWCLDRLSTRDKTTHVVRMPGYGSTLLVTAADESQLLAVARGDAVDLYTGTDDTHYKHFTMPREVLIRLAWWVMTWWVLSQWCGLRVWLWYAVLGRLVASSPDGPQAPRRIPRTASPRSDPPAAA